MKCSVVIPVFNAERTIAATVDSVLAQTAPPTEVIVIDDGSTDDTCNVLRRYGDTLKVISTQNAGCPAARNTGIGYASGDAIAFLDHDDVWIPEKLERQSAVLDLNTDVGLVYCDYEPFGEAADYKSGFTRSKGQRRLTKTPCLGGGFKVSQDQVFDVLIDDLVAVPGTWLIRRNVLQRVGGFDPSLRRGGEDWELLLRLAKQTTFAFVDATLMRRLEAQRTLSRRHLENEMSTCRAVLVGLQERVVLTRAELRHCQRRISHVCNALGYSSAREHKMGEAASLYLEGVIAGLRARTIGPVLANLRGIAGLAPRLFGQRFVSSS